MTTYNLKITTDYEYDEILSMLDNMGVEFSIEEEEK